MNSILNNIKKTVVDPAVRGVKKTMIGYVVVVYHDERKVDLEYRDENNSIRIAQGVRFPNYGDGVFTESLKEGDMVEIAFRNQASKTFNIISVIKRGQSAKDFVCEKGSGMPLSTYLF